MTTSTGGPAVVRCRLFGAFAVEIDGEPVRLRSRRARALLAFLVVAGPGGASRERLSGLLWSDRGEEQARASLRQCLLELRRELDAVGAHVLDIGREQVSLRPGGVGSDFEDLQTALRRHDAAALVTDVRQIGPNPLVEDLSVGGLFDEWLSRTRAQVDSAIELEFRRMIEAAEESRDWDQLRAVAEAYLLRAPTDEVVAAAAIRADMAQGITSAAHRRFRALESTLANEYGLRPGSTVSQAMAAKAEPSAQPTAQPATQAAEPPAQATAAAPARAADPTARPIVVVGAFESADLDAQTLALAQLFRDEVVSGLSRFRDVVVITDPQPITVVDSAGFSDPRLVFALGARLRAGGGMTVQLVRLHTRGVAWSERFDVPEAETLSAIDTIVARVVGAVLPSIDLHLVLPAREADSDSIYLQFLRARSRAMGAATHEEALGAADDLRALIAAHPNFVMPYPQLAGLLNTDFRYTRAGSSDTAAYDEALALAKTALNLDRGHDHCYTLTAWCYLRRREFELAGRFLDQALSRNLFNARRLAEVGFALVFLDERDRARELLNRCLLVNPTPEDSFFHDLGLLEMVCGNHERAATYFDLVANRSIWNTVCRSVNAELAGRSDSQFAERARVRIAAIWPDDREMTEDAVVGWARKHHVFRSREVDERFEAGVRMMLAAASDPAKPAAREPR
jgi:DNA-binding SARP family transcriptional activator